MVRRPTSRADDGARFATVVEEGRVRVQTRDGLLSVADFDAVVEAVGGPAWTIEYTDWHHERYPDLDTSDEGLTVDVRDIVEAMEHDERFVRILQAMPATAVEGGLSPRAGLFVGKLLENLQSGVD
ncbi:hypothetical protein ACFQE8_06100 [Salinirubellus sp. GCM10025818]|uniref:hypothetical protein n=1 Tax=Salinirubellus TaxID=2162630 RepID=UPI0030D3E24F